MIIDYIIWQYNNLAIPMLVHSELGLLATTRAVCAALDLTEEALRSIHHRRKGHFSDLSVAKCNATAMLREHREIFTVERVRDDARLWTENDVIRFALYSNSDAAETMVDDFIAFVKHHAVQHAVSLQDYAALQAQLEQVTQQNTRLQEQHDALAKEVGAMRSMFELAQPRLSEIASAAGTALVNQRELKRLGLKN